MEELAVAKQSVVSILAMVMLVTALLAAAMPLMPAEVEWREGLVKMGVEVAM
jgi:hypothetical protein